MIFPTEYDRPHHLLVLTSAFWRLLHRKPQPTWIPVQKSGWVAGCQEVVVVLVSARPCRKRVSATQAAAKSPRWRDSSMPCGRESGSPTAVTRIAAGEGVGELRHQRDRAALTDQHRL